MARKKRNRSGQRDASPIPTTTLPSPVVLPVNPISLASLSYQSQLAQTKAHLQWMRQTEDQRHWSPHKPKPAKTVAGIPSGFSRRISARNLYRTARVLTNPRIPDVQQRFLSPNRVLVCIRRKIRKQIMFALGLRHKGGAGGKRRHNEYSRIKC